MHDLSLALKHSIEAKRRAGVLVSERRPFANSTGTFTGKPDRARSFGELPEVYWPSAEQARYTIYSYTTPIAWLRGDGVWAMPAVTYSQTTTTQQGVVLGYLLLGEQVDRVVVSAA